MKSITVLGLLCGLLVGCAEETKEVVSEVSDAPLTVQYSLKQVACTNPFPSKPLKIINRSVDLQIDNTVDSHIVELHIQGFDFWGIKVNSVTFTNPTDSYQDKKLVLVNCIHDNPLQQIAWENGFGTSLNYPELFPNVSEDVQVIIMTHEIGHVIGLPESSEWSLMNGEAGYKGANTITPTERKFVESVL